MRLQLKTKNGRKLRIFFMKRIRGAGCVVRVTGPTDRRGESVTAERETAPVDMFQAGQILSVIARETYIYCLQAAEATLPSDRQFGSVGRAFGYQFRSLVWGLGFAPEQRPLFSSEANKMRSVSTHNIIVR